MSIDDVRVVFENLPYTISGFSVSNSDMSYTIVLNSNATHEKCLETYKHELRHIFDKDFDKLESIDSIESYSHGLK